MLRSRILILNAMLLLALLGSHWGRSLESATIAHKDVLERLALPFRDWKSSDSAIAPSDWKTLEPDAALVRNYHSPQNQSVELTVVMGHRKRTVHTPTLCMTGGGWEILSQRYLDIPLPGRQVHAMRQLMMRQGHLLMMTYFFTDGIFCSPSLAHFQTVQLVSRLKANVPIGALVRTIVPVGSDVAAAENLSDSFTQATLPTLLQTIRNTRLQMR